eukprot:8279678-Alexandrium_andersonii.AAC.1
MGVDKSQTLAGRTRDQIARLLELGAVGVEVFLLTGRDYSLEYKAVGRTWSGVAMSHAKVVVADHRAVV